ncbi:hypothetical protein [Chryseobacterium balustinum]|uniref:Conjugal transfer protein TraK n=1 Tax=Chryseobacterium balustinum TaxID=246 RepID=A0ABY1LEX9_9FLAO|nr:hypothetical protein [Chryseobacterium balustinum]AZB32106.1 hypothetical protein EB354_22770 [Chryseobacterium balustinum]SKB94184.1 hypothetical protein SAMN05421800_11574 [Chryseobacterium balustinum]
MTEKNIAVGKNIYTDLNKNRRAVWGILIIAVVSIISFTYFSLVVYSDSTSKIYTINNRGDLIPLSLVDEQRDKIKVVQSNAEYFAKQLYELDQYNLKDKKEKLLWLIDKQPTAIIKDKERKNYYSNFLSINGLIQKVEIVPDSWEITQVEDNPLVNFSVIIKRINGNNEEFFKADIKLRMTKVHINYPYNPFGYLIMNFEESLSRIEKPSDEEQQSLDSLKINQPKPSVQ